MRSIIKTTIILFITFPFAQEAVAQLMEWEAQIGGLSDDRAYSVQQAFKSADNPDGTIDVIPDGYILAGYRRNEDSETSVLVKVRPDGTEEWIGSVSSAVYASGYDLDVTFTQDGLPDGYVAFGRTSGGLLVLKSNLTGDPIWEKEFDTWDGRAVFAQSGVQTKDGGYLVVGNTEIQAFGNDVWILKLNESGDMQGSVFLRQLVRDNDKRYIRDIQQTKDEGFILTGLKFTDGCYGMTDYWVLKLDKNLNVEYENRFGEGCAQSRAFSYGAMSVKEAFNPTSSNPDGYILSGCSRAGTWVIKTDLTLSKVWDRVLSGRCGYGVVQSNGNVDRTDDNGFVVAKADNGLTLEKLEYEYGHTLWNTHIDSTTGGTGTAWSFEKTADSGFVAGGWDGEGDIWVVKISEEGEYTPAGANVEAVPVDSISGETPVTMTFENVAQAGTTHLEVMTGGNPPEGFRLKPLNTFYKLDFTGSLYPMSEIRICIDLTDVTINNANSLKLEHREDVTWEPTDDQQIGYDSDGSVIEICGTVYSLSDFAVFERINNPPVADAGNNQVVQCTSKEGTAVITLDGSGSYDSDEDDLNYAWDENGLVLGNTQTVIADLYLGDHQISLTVDDGIDTDADETVVNIYASIEGIAELTRGFISSDEIGSLIGNKLLDFLADAEENFNRGKQDKAQHNLDQFKQTIDKEYDKGNIAVNIAEILTGSADCVSIFTL